MPDLRNLDELAEYAQAQVDRLERLHAQLADQRAEGRSPRGFVRAETGPGGALLDLTIDPNGLRLSAPELAAEVSAAIASAQRDFAARVDDIMAPVLGMRPSEESLAQMEDGIGRLDALADRLDDLAKRQESRG